ncbi:hypothetical protein SEA_HAGER_73 [Microbacterium phage Hager]|nr:hypothetical protein SEA_HAGER_73 [Microbacterium phage Hager]
MITLNITPDGDITISQETPGERIYMGEHYARMEREEKELAADDVKADMFKQGWESAVREAQLQYVGGRIEEFFQDMKVGSIETEVKEDGGEEGWGDASDDYEGLTDPVLDAADPPLIRPAVDSGEPEKERDTTSFRGLDGVWTISDDELQARLDAEFERGVTYVSPTVPRRYSQEEIAALKNETAAEERAKIGSSVKFSALRAIADGVAAEGNANGVMPSLDDLLVRVAEKLGHEVTR